MSNKPASILYAEDDDEDRFLFLEGMRCVNENISIINANNGREVINHLLKIAPGGDLPLAIVSDLRMPLCDGLDLLRIIKQDRCWKHIPVILFSTSSSRADITLAKSLGVKAFFTKPGTYQEFIETVQEILAVCKECNCSK